MNDLVKPAPYNEYDRPHADVREFLARVIAEHVRAALVQGEQVRREAGQVEEAGGESGQNRSHRKHAASASSGGPGSSAPGKR